MKTGLWILCWLGVQLFSANFPSSVAKNGMVVSNATLASEAGLEMLRRGGNAIDAAVATGFALAVTWPMAGNLGGGGFMLLRLADGKQLALDFREKAPASATKNMFLGSDGKPDPEASTYSYLAVGVPGTVDGLLQALDAHGTLKREVVLAPAIRLAREGFPLSEELVVQFEAQLERMSDYPASMAIFSKKGKAYKVGEIWRQEDLAKTLERIAENGRDEFYTGETAKRIVSDMAAHKGMITSTDLAIYRAQWREPVRGNYRGYEVVGMPPPSSGGVLLIEMLNMLENYDLRSMGWGSAKATHLMIEVERRAYADRAKHLGDPDFWKNPIHLLTSKDFAKKRLADFNPLLATRSETIQPGVAVPEHPETTHFSVADGKGNLVSCTVTLNYLYGNKAVVPGTGFLLNNEMDDFSASPGVANTYGLTGSEANAIAPQKRMLSSMCPVIVLKNEKPFLIAGSPGGSTIISTVLQVVVNQIDYEMDLAEAVTAPRFHHQWLPDQVLFERFAISPDTLAMLKLKGHQNLLIRGEFLGAAHCIRIQSGKLYGAIDPRRGWAMPVGF